VRALNRQLLTLPKGLKELRLAQLEAARVRPEDAGVHLDLSK
jgi:hypothetical protein